MKKKVVIRGPALSRSGYGEHTRFLLRALRPHEDKYELYLMNVGWGQTGWVINNDEERKWVESLIVKMAHYNPEQQGPMDASIQVSIASEWEKLADINIGVTAGIETTKLAPMWIVKGNDMDKIIVISDHSKQIFETSACTVEDSSTGEKIENYHCTTPVEIVHYPVRSYTPEPLEGFELDYDFNFLVVAQWGVRKNLDNTIKWFVEEFKDKEVGLVVKTNMAKDNIRDRLFTELRLRELLGPPGDRKCKVYLLHGSLTEGQLTWVYSHENIKALVTATHGEGFGLPIFEAAYSGMPIVAPLWSGHVDFLYAPNKKGKMRPMCAQVRYSIQPVQPEAVWEGVVEKDSMWCYPYENDFKKQLKEVFKNYNRFKSNATRLKKRVLKEFASEKQHTLFADTIIDVVGVPEDTGNVEDWLASLEVNEYE